MTQENGYDLLVKHRTMLWNFGPEIFNVISKKYLAHKLFDTLLSHNGTV